MNSDNEDTEMQATCTVSLHKFERPAVENPILQLRNSCFGIVTLTSIVFSDARRR